MPRLKKRISYCLVFLMYGFFGIVTNVNAAPHTGDRFYLLQPDGTHVEVKVWGDEYYQRVETPDGYTLIRDPDTGWICYAKLAEDGYEFVLKKHSWPVFIDTMEGYLKKYTKKYQINHK